MSPRWEPNPNIRSGRTVVHTRHAHLVFTPKVALSRLVGSLKGVCARRLRQEFPGHIRSYR
ncbi:transposase [Streptomyces sp. NPDC007856]|uniref:transposase n=1 Tax=Streptomyces sp. NPDC007856 TaxID=3364781 RepID=UPI0036AD57D5